MLSELPKVSKCVALRDRARELVVEKKVDFVGSWDANWRGVYLRRFYVNRNWRNISQKDRI